MAPLTFEESLQLRQVSSDVFENIHEPWTWRNSMIVPGGLLMSECAVAAYETVPSDFVLDSLQTHFLGGPSPNQPMIFKVQRLSNGKRFAVRGITMEQNGKTMLAATLSFVNGSPWTGPAMTHSVARQTSHEVPEITLDDLGPGRRRLGPFMKFQRLPLVYKDALKSPESGTATSAAHIMPPVSNVSGMTGHILGIINLSDYHIMDAAMQLSGITFGLPVIGDHSRAPTKDMSKLGTTLNHTINFHTQTGFRADEMTYIETSTLWAKDGRAMMSTKIFAKSGLLIATCIQEAFYVLKEDPPTRTLTKL